MIAITSAKDVHVLREAMHLGVVHYIVKPFTFTTFDDRLETYASLTSQLDHIQQAEQPDIDRLYGSFARATSTSLCQGHLRTDARACRRHSAHSDDRLSSAELATLANLSQGIARRYLRFLADSGTVNLTLRYAPAGRPDTLPLGGARASGPGLTGVTSRYDATVSEPTSTPASISSAMSARL